MIINNRIDRSFGPVGTASGVFLFIIGLASIYFSYFAIIPALIGAFVGFTSTSTAVDYERRRVRFSNNIFGILKLGQWISIEQSMKIGIKKSNKTWRAYSRSNRTLDIEDKDFRIFLFNSDNKQILPIIKTNSLTSAKEEMKILCNQLGLSTI